MSKPDNMALVKRYLDEAWDKGNVAIADELLAPGFRGYAGGRTTGREEEKQLTRMFLASFGNFRTTIEQCFADGDRVYVYWTALGTHQGPFANIPPSGKQVRMSGMEIHRVENGRIAEIRAEFDMMGLMQELGAIPRPPQAQVPPPDNEGLVRRFFTEVLNGQQLEKTAELLSPDFVDHALPPHSFSSDVEFLKNFWPGVFRRAFPDWEITVEEVRADADKVVARYSATGTHQGEYMGIPGSGRRIHVTGMNLFRLAHGRIVEEWPSMDQMSMMQQLRGEGAPSEPEAA